MPIFDGLYGQNGVLRSGNTLVPFTPVPVDEIDVSDLNDAGVVVGYSGSNGFYYDGTYHQIGTFGGGFSIGSGVNAYNEIVGRTSDSAENLLPFLLKDGSMYNLAANLQSQLSSYIQLQIAWDINDRGVRALSCSGHF